MILVLHHAFASHQTARAAPETQVVVYNTALIVFFVFALIAGVVAWFFVLAQDSRKVAEEESSRQTTLLLKEIAAHEKTDAALQAAKEAAESANRAKSRYVVGLSHELRTPLNAVSGYAQLLERDPTIPEARQPAIQSIRRSADYLSGLIDGLLDISRIESGRLQVYSNEINLDEFLDQIVDIFETQARAKGLAFRHGRDRNLPAYVRTDEKRLRQILVNLLSNAVKFTPEGGKVKLRGFQAADGVVLQVSDTGIGISEDDLQRVGRPFEQIESQHSKKHQGSGLGLALSKSLIEMHGGALRIDSRLGEGTTVSFTLPAEPIVADAGPAPRPSGQAAQTDESLSAEA